MKQKSIFTSLTFWGIVLGYLNTLVPLVELGSSNGFDSRFYTSVVEASIAFAIALIGRYNADSAVFTPAVLPGRNKKRN